jgi:hypothetical protein
MRLRLLSVPLCLVLCACSRTAPEEALRQEVDAMRTAVEARDVGELSDGIADDFIGPEGMDRKGATRLAQVVFLRNRDVGVTMGPLDIAMREGGATVKFTAALTGGSGGMLPASGQVYDVSTTWRRKDDEWELVSAEWSPKL